MPSQNGPGSDGNEEVLHIPQSSSITRTSPSDCLVSYPGLSWEEGSYPSAKKHSVYSTAPTDWTKQTTDIIHEKTWTGLRKGNLKRETESLLIAVQNNAIRNMSEQK